MEFREAFPKEGLYWTYSDEQGFSDVVRRHLTRFIRHIHEGKDKHTDDPPAITLPAPTKSHDPAASARDLLSRAAAIPVSTLALEALLLARQIGDADAEWLELEVSGYPRGEPDHPEEVFPGYRTLTIHASQVFPSRLWIWKSLEPAITARPDLFVMQVLYYPRSLTEVETDLLSDPEGFFVLWKKSEKEMASGPHDANYGISPIRHGRPGSVSAAA